MSNFGDKYILADKFLFDPNNNSLFDQVDEQTIRLGSNESRILLLLAQRPNEIVTRAELHEFVWREQGFEVDDSSLTQAISTLRKMLNDSTKNPQFVKTVPKRGYQLICPVESAPVFTTPTQDEESAVETLEAKLNTAPLETQTPVEAPVPASQPLVDESPSVESKPQTRPASKWMTMVTLAVAILLPVLSLFHSQPEEQQFRQLSLLQETPVLAPINHPDLSVWLPSIEQCVTRYMEKRSDQQLSAPIEVIATGGQNNLVVLNYIHPVEDSGSSYSQQLISEPNTLTKICE
ncbi:winged helix-turn-helix domain-containing protein [Vibrio sp. WXL103]|uniref:winged helix-turn-helix domain-containing protein n=1 Tax=unclassified Vibrio TaxID=2614977 RepID=UPI003EC91D30